MEPEPEPQLPDAALPPEHEPPREHEPSPEPEPPLAEMARSTLRALAARAPATVDGVPPEHHYLPPHLGKRRWAALGDAVAARERACGTLASVPGERWISLRLDGSGFSSAVRKMRSLGVLEPSGFSARFAAAMVACTRGLMDKFNGVVGYTQSDELIVFLAPTSVVRGERQPHTRSGRVTKITTLAAGYVTARFTLELSKAVVAEGGDLDATLGAVLPHFDCRMGDWESWEEAQSLLLWRGYDCSVNGISDAVHHSGLQGKKKALALATPAKVAWLHEHAMLPLPLHQAYGTVLTKVKRRVVGVDPRHPEKPVTALRSRIEQLHGPVLETAARSEHADHHGFFPEGDTPSDGELEELEEAARLKAAEKAVKAEKAERKQQRTAAAATKVATSRREQ